MQLQCELGIRFSVYGVGVGSSGGGRKARDRVERKIHESGSEYAEFAKSGQ